MNHGGGPTTVHGFRRRVTVVDSSVVVLREPEWGMANKQRQLSEGPVRQIMGLFLG
ncbi:hypothetical protein [Corynebacterium provencense]|jgi:hypothetical protein|uniref:hypothetical protein n=1 Tax=Corynebacterium provencense TaxID=1737425 RepID=UPI0012B52390|nr:hypothetical protein [Corynebacterium provencense]MCI1256222.1 hypothetical protein [Corynebacterium provencense]